MHPVIQPLDLNIFPHSYVGQRFHSRIHEKSLINLNESFLPSNKIMFFDKKKKCQKLTVQEKKAWLCHVFSVSCQEPWMSAVVYLIYEEIQMRKIEGCQKKKKKRKSSCHQKWARDLTIYCLCVCVCILNSTDAECSSLNQLKSLNL